MSMQVTEPVTQPATSPSGRMYERDDYANCVRALSPLARAALANGVAFDDVFAYCNHAPRTAALVYDALLLGDAELTADYMSADAVLDRALARSVLAQGTIEHARLWWRGVL